MNPLISIVIPIFNAEVFLKNCLEGVACQEYMDFEVILINDGSTDRSARICNEYCDKDDRFNAFHQHNKGVSTARNIGIEKAKGVYIVFIDSDDKVLPNYLKDLLYSNSIPSGTLVIQDTRIEYENKVFDRTDYDEYYIANLLGEKGKTQYLMAGPPYGKLLERSILINNNIRFNENISTNEDHIFHLEYLIHIKSVKKVSGIGYIYVRRNIQTLSNKKICFEELYYGLSIIKARSLEVIKRFQLKDKNVINSFNKTFIDRIYAALYSLYQPPFRKENPERSKLLHQWIINYRIELERFDNNSDFFKRILFLTIRINNIYIIDSIFCGIFKLKNIVK